MQDLIDFMREHRLVNRTTVSRDIEPLLARVAELAGLPLTLHRFPSGAEHGTWIVPPRWDVNEAWLKGPDGKTIASYDEHPLFLAPYSIPFSGTLPLDEIKEHVAAHPFLDEGFYYEHRLAYDFRRRLKEWRITLPRTLLDSLPPGDYQVHIDVDVAEGEMLVGEICLPGESDDAIALLADYCHPAQVNDSFTGIAVMVDVLRRLKAAGPLRHTVKLYLFAETIGSCVFLAARPDIAEKTRVAMFCEFVGWGGNWTLAASRKERSLAALLAEALCRAEPDLVRKRFFESGTHENDELIFEYAGVPSLSLHRFPVEEYHSSLDEPSRLDPESLRRASDLMLRLCRLADMDRVYARTQNVPPYLTRFDLYLDGLHQIDAARAQRALLYAIDGRRSLLEICRDESIDIDFAAEFAHQLHSTGLLALAPDG